ETFAADEKIEPSGIPGILRVRAEKEPNRRSLLQRVEMLEKMADAGDADGAVRMLREIVPSFDPLERRHKSADPFPAPPAAPAATPDHPANGAAAPGLTLLMEPLPSK